MSSAFFALLLAAAVPAIAHYYQVTAAHAEGVMSWYLLGYGICPLTYAPLANRYGRKAALLIGFTLALLAFALDGSERSVPTLAAETNGLLTIP